MIPMSQALRPMSALEEQRLRELLASFESLIIAFSGGVDSAYLAWVATQVLGPPRCASPPTAPAIPIGIASWRFGRRPRVQPPARDHPHARTGARPNTASTRSIAATTASTSSTRRSPTCAPIVGSTSIADGSNADDRGDYRPGRQAAREFGVRSPLDEVDLTKAEIRELSHRAGLPTWDEPASACLSSRIPYHSEVTPRKAADDRARRGRAARLGFRVCRVRHHELTASGNGSPSTLAQLEIAAEELARALEPEIRSRIVGADPGHRLSTRDDRSAGLPHGQSERRSSSRSHLARRDVTWHQRTNAPPHDRPLRTLLRDTSQVFVHWCRHSLTRDRSDAKLDPFQTRYTESDR